MTKPTSAAASFFQAIYGHEVDAVRTALLRKQLFPFAKPVGEELPDLFTSESFTDACAQEVAALPWKPHGPAGWVELRTRRFDGLVRRLGVPHPVPYARLVQHVGVHWSDLRLLLDSPVSRIKPLMHADGRIIQMDYDSSATALSRDTRLAQGKQFLVKADISNCFPSIYSHALDWATRTKQVAKASRNDGSWQARLDQLASACHDGETKGLMIGPAVSNLLSELVLQRVDEELTGKGYTFVRYIDDYATYCGDRAEAERFVVDLQHSLSRYRLDLNTRKTRIVDLRDGVGEPWMADVLANLPHRATKLNSARFLRQCEVLAAEYPLNSVLKFGIKTLRGQRRREKRKASMQVADELVRLSLFHPHLAPFVARELEELSPTLLAGQADRIASVLIDLMVRAAERGETDVVLWLLHVVRRVLKRQVLKAAWQPLLEMDDDMVAVALAVLCGRTRAAVRKRVLGWDYFCETDYQQHWLARYELFRVGLLKKGDLTTAEKQWMKILIKHKVRFSELA